MTDETRTSLPSFIAEGMQLGIEVGDLADYADKHGYSQLTRAMQIGNGMRGITATAEAINHLSKCEIFMIRAGAKDLYPRWCEAFGLEINT